MLIQLYVFLDRRNSDVRQKLIRPNNIQEGCRGFSLLETITGAILLIFFSNPTALKSYPHKVHDHKTLHWSRTHAPMICFFFTKYNPDQQQPSAKPHEKKKSTLMKTAFSSIEKWNCVRVCVCVRACVPPGRPSSSPSSGRPGPACKQASRAKCTRRWTKCYDTADTCSCAAVGVHMRVCHMIRRFAVCSNTCFDFCAV